MPYNVLVPADPGGKGQWSAPSYQDGLLGPIIPIINPTKGLFKGVIGSNSPSWYACEYAWFGLLLGADCARERAAKMAEDEFSVKKCLGQLIYMDS